MKVVERTPLGFRTLEPNPVSYVDWRKVLSGIVNLFLGFSPTSCIKDNSYSNLHAPEKNVAQFKFNAFSFLKSYDVVYVQCKVAVCRLGDHSSRCSQGCLSRGRRGAGSAEVREEQTEYFQTVGPLKIHREANQSKVLV